MFPFFKPNLLAIKYTKDQAGQGMSEYLILTLLIAVASITAAHSIGTTLFTKFNQVHESLQTVTIESVRGNH